MKHINFTIPFKIWYRNQNWTIFQILICTKFDPLASIRETMFSLPEYCSATISHFHIFNATSKAIATLAIANPQIEKLLYSDLDVLEKMSKLKEKWPWHLLVKQTIVLPLTYSNLVCTISFFINNLFLFFKLGIKIMIIFFSFVIRNTLGK